MFGQKFAASAVFMLPCALALRPSGSLYAKMTLSVVAVGKALIVWRVHNALTVAGGVAVGAHPEGALAALEIFQNIGENKRPGGGGDGGVDPHV
jgi:hypothetical protein